MTIPKRNILQLGAATTDYQKLGVGNKARLISQALNAGLPVPAGNVVLEEAWGQLQTANLVKVTGEDVQIADAAQMLDALALPKYKSRVAVRSAFAAEDGDDSALAGYFNTHLHISPDSAQQFAEALADVWQSGTKYEQASEFRRDILVMEMVDAKYAGVAFTEAAYEDDLVNYTQGTAEKLVGGQEAGESVTLPKLRAWERPTPDAAFLRRLQNLLRDVRRLFKQAGSDWDIEWADDGQVCWLLQVRPVTRPPRRNEAFTYANLKEIMPDPPSPFMTSIVTESAVGFFDWYRQFDSTLPTNRRMVETFYERPLFNISLLTDMMRHWGLPTTLVTNSIGGSADREVGFKLGRFLASTIPLLRLGWRQLTAVGDAEQHTRRIQANTAQSADSFTTVVDTFRDLFTAFVTEMFNLTQAMSAPLLILRRSGTLGAHAAQNRTISTEMFTELEALRALVAERPTLKSALAEGNLPDDATFRAAWQGYLAKHGHRGIYESDIARPRYQESPEPLLHSLAVDGASRPSAPNASGGRLPILRWVTKPLWWQLRRVMRARERWRYESMRWYLSTRTQLLVLAQKATQAGQLPSVDMLWLLTAEEVRSLDEGKLFSAEFFTQRQADIDRMSAYDMPDLLYRFDDLDALALGEDDDTEGPLRGISLTGGKVEGRAWVLNEPAVRLPDGFDPATTILVARSVDAGWISTFAQVAGAIVEIGGDLSHGSIILREIGLPAITNVRGVTRNVTTGEELMLYAGRGTAHRMKM
ncbi:MAG: PEP/pyruvate-binding domain-containing protein [Chloroflexota bacterium]